VNGIVTPDQLATNSSIVTAGHHLPHITYVGSTSSFCKAARLNKIVHSLDQILSIRHRLMARSLHRQSRNARIVTGLSAMTCDLTRKPLVAVGSTVTRKSGASLHSEVIWQTTTDA
jgi:hypothetical protein